MIECKECGSGIDVDNGTEIGEIIVCSDCGKDYEVKFLDPFEMIDAPIVKEDWGE